MIPVFKWATSRGATAADKHVYEAKITEMLATGRITSCHSGSVDVNVSVENPPFGKLVGNIKCHCGTPIALINEDVNGTTIRRCG
jgi:hypothetical protein